MTGGAGGWTVERRRATAGMLHDPWPPAARVEDRAVAVCDVDGGPALVLGSAQPEDAADRVALEAAGVALVRRRSGGGAVLVAPGRQVWIDVWVPREDALWDDDVLRGAWWLGETWASALHALGVSGLDVHRGRATATPADDVLCFAGIGPGEVTVDGRKVVGLAQRRTRHGARLTTTALLEWDPAPLAGLLSLGEDERHALVRATAGAAVGLIALLHGARREDGVPDADALRRRVEEAVLRQLPGSADAGGPART